MVILFQLKQSTSKEKKMKDDQARVGDPVDNGEYDMAALKAGLVDKFISESTSDDESSYIVQCFQEDLAEYISATPEHLSHVLCSMATSNFSNGAEYSQTIINRVAAGLVANDPDLVAECL